MAGPRGAGHYGTHIETGTQAQQLVDACYFAPLGHRSWGTHRGTAFNDDELLGTKYGGRREFAEFANANTLVYAQVESQLGYANLDEILAVKGLHAIAFGPYDLGFSLGLPGAGADNPEIGRILADIEARTRAAGNGLPATTSSILASSLRYWLRVVHLLLNMGMIRFQLRHMLMRLIMTVPLNDLVILFPRAGGIYTFASVLILNPVDALAEKFEFWLAQPELHNY